MTPLIDITNSAILHKVPYLRAEAMGVHKKKQHLIVLSQINYDTRPSVTVINKTLLLTSYQPTIVSS